MSNLTRLTRPGRAAIALAAGLGALAVPAAAQAATVNLATAAPFVALGGAEVTNSGPSVLNGDLGVSPGTSLTGFQFATVNGVTHDNDAVASQAQGNLTTAYNVAAAEPTTADLTGQDLGGLTLTPGAYEFSSSAQLTGQLTLDAQGVPNAQFVFKIGSTLTTASASSVVMINGASPCNVFWQVGSSATLGSTTAFQGNVMADQSITLNNGASVIGRVLARIGTISLINNVLDGSSCGAGSTPPPVVTPPGTPLTRAQAVPVGQSTTPTATHDGTASLSRSSRNRRGGFRARVRGHLIKRVVFRLDGKRIASRGKAPFRALVRRTAAGKHTLRARVTFKDSTQARTLTLRYRTRVLLHPPHGPSRFTG